MFLLLVTGRVPTQTMRKKGEIPKSSHTFVLFDPPKLGKFNDPCLFASMFAVSLPCSQARSEGRKSSIEQVWAAIFWGSPSVGWFLDLAAFYKRCNICGHSYHFKILKQLHLKIVWLRHLHQNSVCVCVFFFSVSLCAQAWKSPSMYPQISGAIKGSEPYLNKFSYKNPPS